MSKIGKRPIAIPAGVKIHLEHGVCTVSHGANKQTVTVPYFLDCQIDKDVLTVVPLRLRDKHMRAMWGTVRALISNAVEGLTKGYEKNLELKGLGYKAEVKGANTELFLGYSHIVKFANPEDVKIKCAKPTHIVINGADKQRVGQVAANLKRLRKHNRYKDYGIYEMGQWRYIKVRKSK